MTATKQPAKKLDRPAEAAEAEATSTDTDEVQQTDLLTTREVAEALGTDPRTLRKFLRDDPSIENAGKGNRYEFKRSQLKSMTKRFHTWAKARQAEADQAKAEAEATPASDEDTLREQLGSEKVAEIKSLLNSHGIDYPSKANKAELVDIAIRERDLWA